MNKKKKIHFSLAILLHVTLLQLNIAHVQEKEAAVFFFVQLYSVLVVLFMLPEPSADTHD